VRREIANFSRSNNTSTSYDSRLTVAAAIMSWL
jgi:hypothetical protein